MTQTRLQLNLPGFDYQGDGELPRNARKLAEWLEDMPPLDPARSIQQTLESILACNSAEMSDGQRLEYLNLYRRRAKGMFETFDTAAFNQNLAHRRASTDKVRKQIGQLFQELANGYKRIVTSCFESGQPATRNLVYRDAIYGAMEQTVLYLLHTFRTYGPIPRFSHRDIHQLFHLAEQQQVLFQDVEMGGQPAQFGSIGRLYKHFMLLSIADPFHLGPGQLLPVFLFISRYVSDVQIQALARDAHQEDTDGQFCIDLASDSAPTPCNRGPGSRARLPYLMDVTKVLRHIHRDQQNKTASKKHKLQAEQASRLLGTLQARFHGSSSRGAERKADNRPVAVIIGMQSLHFYLADQLNPDPEVIHSTGERYQVEVWSLVDRSKKGFRLRANRRARFKMRVGDVIGIAVNADEELPHIGFIRWLRFDSRMRVTMGIELSRARPLPITINTPVHVSPPVNITPCLALKYRKRGMIALIPKHLDAPGQELSGEANGHPAQFHLGAREMETSWMTGRWVTVEKEKI